MTNVFDVNAEKWESLVLKSELLTVVDFWHEKCPWCLLLDPVFEEVAMEYAGRVKFVRFNVLSKPENRALALKNGVMGTPTIAFYCNGQYLGSVVGFTSTDQLKRAVEDFMKFKECANQSTKLEDVKEK